MGYRHYLYAVPKKQVAEIQACKTNDDWCNFSENYGYEVSRDYCDDGSGWLSPYKIGTELYELGKYSEIGSVTITKMRFYHKRRNSLLIAEAHK